jgi:uncharacterized protein YndB with AHSA1/START domain
MTEEFLVEREIFIAAPPEAVFRFFVEPTLMARWIGCPLALDPRPGGVLRVELSSGATARGTYSEITPNRRIAFSWGWEGRDDLPPGKSLVEIELEAKEGGTLVRLRHSGLAAAAEPPFTRDDHGRQWSHYLERLQQQCAISERDEGRIS